MRMKLAGAALLALGTLTATVGTADAAQGCGPGFHRNWAGFCRPNWRPFAYAPVYYARPVVYGYGWGRPWGWHHHRGWGYRW